MPRTEKKFGQVNQASAGVMSELVPTSANRRNVLLNLTGRSNATVTAATFSGAPSISKTVVPSLGSAQNLVTGTLGTGAAAASSGMIRTMNINRAKNRLLLSTTTDGKWYVYSVSSNSSGISLTATGNTSWGSSNPHTGAILGNYTPGTVHQLQTNSLQFIDDTYFMLISNTSTTTTSTDYRLVFGNAPSSVTELALIYQTANNNAVTTYRYISAIPLQNSVGMVVGGHNTSGSSSISEAVSLRVFYGGSIAGGPGQAAAVQWNNDGTNSKQNYYARHFFLLGDYNTVNPVFAFTNPVNAGAWHGVAAASGLWDLSTNLPVLPGQAPAGFRLVANDSAGAASRKFLDGTITFPAAPTGVTLPTEDADNPTVRALHFSPDGNYLAVAYNRGTFGTAATNTATSHVVIYTRQENGSYIHTHSSGANLPYGPYGHEGLTWSSDSKALYVQTYVNPSGTSTSNSWVYVWYPFSSGSSVSDSSVSTWTVAYTKYPNTSSYTAPAGGTVDITQNTTANGSLTMTDTNQKNVFLGHMPGTGIHAGWIWVYNGYTNTNQGQTPTSAVMPYATLAYTGTVGTATTAPNYVNTVAQSIGVSSGTVTQISNIVLENGERLYIEPSASNAADVVAYGVEIS